MEAFEEKQLEESYEIIQNRPELESEKQESNPIRRALP